MKINQGVKRLLKRGLIEIKEDENYKFLKITDKGKRLLLKYELEGLVQDKPKKWDKNTEWLFSIYQNKEEKPETIFA